MTTNNQPIDRVRFGAVQAAVWRNQDSEGRVRYNATFERLYRDAEGAWKSTGSFGRDDLLVVAKVAEEAYARVHGLQARDREQAAKAAEANQGAAR